MHSLDDPDFERKDAEAARAFGKAAAGAGVRQIVYLGGLGADDDDLSAHLRSRREVEGLLGEAASRSPCCGRRSWSAPAASPGSSPASW